MNELLLATTAFLTVLDIYNRTHTQTALREVEKKRSILNHVIRKCDKQRQADTEQQAAMFAQEAG